MRDQKKTKSQLIEELQDLRQRVADLQAVHEEADRAATALGGREEAFFAVFDALPGIVFVQAPDHSIPFANRSFVKVYGEPAGKPCYTVLHRRDQPCEVCRTFPVFGAETPHVWEFRHPYNERVYEIYGCPFTGADGSPLVLNFVIDVTPLRQAQEALRSAEQEKAAILDSMSELVCYYQDTDLTVMWANRAAADSLGLSIDEIVGQHCYKLWPQRDEPCEGCPVLKAFETGRTHQSEMTTPDDRRWLVRAYPVKGPEGEVVAVVEVTLDVTERERIEQALKEYSVRLEEMVEERTKELDDAQQELIRKERLAILGELAGGVSHELRNPLATITNAVYFLQMTLAEADETTREYLQLISTQAQNAAKIVSDLLDFSRKPIADRELTPVSQLVSQLLETSVPPANVEVFTLVSPDLPPAKVDPQQIGQVLENLVTNAYQAMPDGGTLTVRAEAHDDQVHLAVVDTGTGVSDGDMDRLFEPLFSTKPGGIGLGLAVSKILVEANAGRIEVESRKGKGSTFRVILPTA